MFNNIQVNGKSRNFSFNAKDNYQIKFQNNPPYLLNPIHTKNQMKPRLYIPNKLQSTTQDPLNNHIDEQLYYRKLTENLQPFKNRQNFQSNTSVEQSNNNESNQVNFRKKPPDLPDPKLKETKPKRSDEISIKKAVLNEQQTIGSLHKSSNHDVFPPDLTDDQLDELLSSESFIVNNVENSHTLFELISFLKIYLKKMEANYSLDDLYTYLKSNIQSGYRNFTIEYLEKHAKNKYTSSLGVYNDTPNESQSNNTKQTRRSLSQLKQSHNQHFAQYSRPHNKLTSKPVKKLIEHLKLFKVIFHIIKRDLILNIFRLKFPKTNSSSTNDHNKTDNLYLAQRPKSRSMNDIYTNTLDPDEVNESSLQRRSMIDKVQKYREILYELNEKLILMINDYKICDTKLLSPHSKLQAKYLYYKHGEYVLRLTTDIISKFQMILNISQTVYYLHYKLEENDFRGTNVYVQSTLDEYSEECEYDREFNFYSCPKYELKKQYAVLKVLPRKRAQAFQKLPKIQNEKIILKNNLLKKFNTSLYKHHDEENNIEGLLGQSLQANYNTKNLFDQTQQQRQQQRRKHAHFREPAEEHTNNKKEKDRDMLIEVLKLRLDSSDSIIRETDSDSIHSDTDSVLCLHEDSDVPYETNKYPIEVYFKVKNQ